MPDINISQLKIYMLISMSQRKFFTKKNRVSYCIRFLNIVIVGWLRNETNKVKKKTMRKA